VINELADPRVVQQLTANACGPACGQMLLRGAGVEAFQSNVAAAAGGVLTSAESLARALNVVEGTTRWAGGYIGAEALGAAVRKGPFGAMLWNPGSRIGHWVVVDSVENGMVGVRDPANATSYMMRLADFLEAWTENAVIRR
jgi:filamentous hemagglutinin